MTNNDYNLLQLLAQVSRAGKQQESCIETEDGAFTTHASHPRFPTRHKVHLAWVKVGVSFIFADMIFYFAERSFSLSLSLFQKGKSKTIEKSKG